jgi:hypothetical protein
MESVNVSLITLTYESQSLRDGESIRRHSRTGSHKRAAKREQMDSSSSSAAVSTRKLDRGIPQVSARGEGPFGVNTLKAYRTDLEHFLRLTAAAKRDSSPWIGTRSSE